MKKLDIRGVRREKRVRTTVADPQAARPPDLVDRDFTADAPNRLWVADLTQVATWSGVAYVCFITDAFSRRVVGWRVAGHMRTQMVHDALEMARWNRATSRSAQSAIAASPAASLAGTAGMSRSVTDMILSGPQQPAADPQTTPLTQNF